MYLVKNKDSGEVELIGSISAIAKHTSIKSSSLYQQFSRNKKVAYIKDKWEIEKKTVIKSKRR
jgi:HD superfamily phosphohydrolase YqeK